MNNFYGKRFLSALMGALSVLSSPVASAGKRRTRDDTLGSGKSSSRRRTNRNVERRRGGKIKSNRKVKSVNGLKKVLKETGGEVVRVSPDGKGGFVAFVKTPTGKVVTVVIVGVTLIAIIAFLQNLVAFYRRKSKITPGGDDPNSENLIVNDQLNTDENNKITDVNKVENVTGKLLSGLFNNEQGEYKSFVNKLLKGFFDDEPVRKMFEKCNGNLDEFLKFEIGVYGVGFSS